MALPLANNAAGGTDETTVTTANSGGTSGNAWNAVSIGSGGTLKFEADTKVGPAGGLSYRFATGVSSVAVTMSWNSTSVDSHARSYGRVYFAISSFSLTPGVCRGRAASNQVFRVSVSSGGLLQLRNSANTVVATGSVTLTASVWYRCHWDISIGASASGSLTIYQGNDLTPLETISTATGNFGTTNFDEYQFGIVGAAASHPNMWLDEIAVTTAGPLGPGWVGGSSTDTLTAGDSPARAVTDTRAVADTLTAGDSPARALTDTRAVADTLTAGDSPARAVTDTRAVADTLTAADTAAGVLIPATPANDNLADAIVLANGTTQVTGSTVGSTGETNENTANHSVWYKWYAPSGSNAAFNTIGSNFDTILTIYRSPYSAPTFDQLIQVAVDDDSGGSSTSSLTFTPTAGQTYYVRVSGWQEAVGNYVLNYPSPAAASGAPANDMLAAAADLEPGTTQVTGSTLLATVEPSEYRLTNALAQDDGGRSVWFRWTPVSTGSATITTVGSSFDTVLSIYKAKAGVTDPVLVQSDLDAVAADDDAGGSLTSSATFTATQGVIYYLQVAGYDLSHAGTYVLNYPSPGSTAPAAWIDDAVQLADTVTAVGTRPRAGADTVAYADTVTAHVAATRGVADSTSAADTVSFARTLPRQATDTLTAADAVTRAFAAAEAVSDALAGADAAARVLAAVGLVADGVNAADTPGRITGVTAQLTDLVEAADVAAGLTSGTRHVGDGAAAADSVNAAASHSRPAADTLGGADSTSRVLTALRQVDDGAQLADEAAGIPVHVRGSADTLAAADASERAVAAGRSCSDTAAAGDTAGRVSAASRAAGDTLAAADEVQLLQGTGRSTDDSTSIVDSPSRGLTAARSAVDGVMAADLSAGQVSAGRLPTDGLSTSDSLQRVKVQVRAAEEQVSIGDADARHVQVDRPAADTLGTGDHGAAQSARIRTAADQISIAAAVAVAVLLARHLDDLITGGDHTLATSAVRAAVDDMLAAADVATGSVYVPQPVHHAAPHAITVTGTMASLTVTGAPGVVSVTGPAQRNPIAMTPGGRVTRTA